MSPWLGLGIGYEVFAPSQAPSVYGPGALPTDRVVRSLEFFNVQSGLDLHVNGPVWLGPYATFTLGKYTNVFDAQFHSWLMGGLRLQVRL